VTQPHNSYCCVHSFNHLPVYSIHSRLALMRSFQKCNS
jgi:hypothetical protein